MRDKIIADLEDSIESKRKMRETLVPLIETAAKWMIAARNNGNQILLFGNGGSAADSQHIAAELVAQRNRQKKPLRAIALTTDTSILTSIANDCGYENVFSKQVEALAGEGDIVICISTSGNSLNVVKGVEKAREIGCKTIGLLGAGGGVLKNLVDLPLAVPSASRQRIQECHITIGHILSRLVDCE
ncbi:MAG: SIS domain-containing protein [Deltaproteobacteria bacterium]|nr:SIS domain-containing protein [Deltaproteobacteria bacterium]